ncbi:MAG: hypothetical protein OXE81_01855 [Gammaproteobacteria bacterium]|nr:hypothetical protein [Gammaproteobacteria bacterium]
MPELEDVFEMDDGLIGDPEDLGESLDAKGHAGNRADRNGCLNRLAIRHAIEAKREQKRIARDLDTFDFDIDDF